MQWKLKLGPAWAKRHVMSDADIASYVDFDITGAVPSDALGRCPRPECASPPEESEVELLLDPDHPSTLPDRVEGRSIVRCLCGVVYWYVAAHIVDTREPIGEARVRAASVTRTPGTGSLQIEGQSVPPLQIKASDDVHIDLAATITLQAHMTGTLA